MTAEQFRQCLDALNWSGRGLARMLDVNFVTVQRWNTGALTVPQHIADWLCTLAAVHIANPPPMRSDEP